MRFPSGSAVLVIYNARAGARANEQFRELLEQKSAEYEFNFKVYKIESANCERKIKKEIDDFNPDLLIAAGGDGTVNLVAKIAPHYDLPVLILPCGSANGMAREMAIPNHITAAYDILADYRIKAVDLLSINGFTCVHLADVGLNARIVKRFDQDTRRALKPTSAR